MTSSLMPTMKWFFGDCLLELIEDGLDHGGSEFFGRKTITATDDFNIGATAFYAGHADDIQVERLAIGAGFLRPVKNGDGS